MYTFIIYQIEIYAHIFKELMYTYYLNKISRFINNYYYFFFNIRYRQTKLIYYYHYIIMYDI